ncbi:hypothetical protein AB1N83_004372 [Pleurotus pulmonarius]
MVYSLVSPASVFVIFIPWSEILKDTERGCDCGYWFQAFAFTLNSILLDLSVDPAQQQPGHRGTETELTRSRRSQSEKIRPPSDFLRDVSISANVRAIVWSHLNTCNHMVLNTRPDFNLHLLSACRCPSRPTLVLIMPGVWSYNIGNHYLLGSLFDPFPSDSRRFSPSPGYLIDERMESFRARKALHLDMDNFKS